MSDSDSSTVSQEEKEEKKVDKLAADTTTLGKQPPNPTVQLEVQEDPTLLLKDLPLLHM